MKHLIAVASLCLFVTSSSSQAQDTLPLPDVPCKVAPPSKGKSRQRFDATAFMTVAAQLEAQGEKNFRLVYEAPAEECLVESFDQSGRKVSAVYNPWQKGTQTLLYKFVEASAEETREVLVLYNGLVGLVAKGHAFHVTETRHGVVAFYAMFKEEPTYQATKDLASSIFSDSSKPLLAVRWPSGAPEGEVVSFDSSKLK